MVRKINNRLYKINTYASEMIVEVDDNYDEEVQKLKKEIQLDSLGCKLNCLYIWQNYLYRDMPFQV